MPKWSDDLLNRLLTVTKTKTPAALARALGTTKQNLNGHKKRGVMPELLLRRAADQFGESYEYLATGERPIRVARRLGVEGAAQAFRRMGLPRDVREAMERITSTMRESPETMPWVEALLTILASGSQGSVVGIQENLNAFLARLGHPEIPTDTGKKDGKDRAVG